MTDITVQRAECLRATAAVKSDLLGQSIVEVRRTLINVHGKQLLVNQNALDLALGHRLSEAVKVRKNLQLSPAQQLIVGTQALKLKSANDEPLPPPQRHTYWDLACHVFGNKDSMGISPSSAANTLRLYEVWTEAQFVFSWFKFRAISFYRHLANHQPRDPLLEGLLLLITATNSNHKWFDEPFAIPGLAMINNISATQLYFVIARLDSFKWQTRRISYWHRFSVHSTHREFMRAAEARRNSHRESVASRAAVASPRSPQGSPSKRSIVDLTFSDSNSTASQPPSSQGARKDPQSAASPDLSISTTSKASAVVQSQDMAKPALRVVTSHEKVKGEKSIQDWKQDEEQVLKELEKIETAIQKHDSDRTQMDEAFQKLEAAEAAKRKGMDTMRLERVAELVNTTQRLREIRRNKQRAEEHTSRTTLMANPELYIK